MTDSLLKYDLAPGVEAFSTRRDCVLPYPVTQAHQNHSANVAVIERAGMTREELEGIDAMVTSLHGVAIGARTADCIPVLMYDPVKSVVAAVHSGWRGTVAKISLRTIEVMNERFGCSPSDILAVIGPGIGMDAFQVGPEVVEAFRDAGFPMEKVWEWRGETVSTPCGKDLSRGHHLDLPLCVKTTLLEAGVQESNIQMSSICTYSSPEFFSARREGISCGRIINSIMLI